MLREGQAALHLEQLHVIYVFKSDPALVHVVFDLSGMHFFLHFRCIIMDMNNNSNYIAGYYDY